MSEWVCPRCGLVGEYQRSADPNRCRECVATDEAEAAAKGTRFWKADGSVWYDTLPWVRDDGGRADAGYKGDAGDCVTRAVAIASQRPYGEVYAELSEKAGMERKSKGATARNGIHTKRLWFKDYMRGLGFDWTPTMQIGSGCKVHLRVGELPHGRLVVALSRHYAAVIDGVVRDTHDPGRDGTRCVYGYWEFTGYPRRVA